MMPTRFAIALLSAVLVAAGVAPVHAQSGVQVARDGRTNLVSKDVGSERWAITYDLDAKTATGNVFRCDGGEPAFVSCETISRNGEAMTMRCFGACHFPRA